MEKGIHQINIDICNSSWGKIMFTKNWMVVININDAINNINGVIYKPEGV